MLMTLTQGHIYNTTNFRNILEECPNTTAKWSYYALFGLTLLGTILVTIYTSFILVILISIVNFINVKRKNFTYERLYSSYILALNKLLYKKH